VLVTLGVIALAAFGVYRWRTSGFRWALFLATFHGVHWGWLTLGAVVIITAYFGRALRWQVMVRPMRENSSAWNIFICTAIGFTAIVFFGRAGELVRPYLISMKERVSFSSQMAAWLLERVLDLLMILVILGIALSQIPNTGLTPGPHLSVILRTGGFIIGLTGAACLLLLLGFRHFGEAMHERILSAIAFLPQTTQDRIGRIMAAFSQGFGSTRRGGFISLLFAYSLFEWLLVIASVICVFRAFPATSAFSFIEILVFMGFVTLGSAVQLPGVGGGMQVASVLVLTELFGLTLEVASGVAIALWLITFVVIVPFGLVLGFHEGIKWRTLSHVAEEVPE
jgi:glycosyltransferase 2 family protein